MAEGFIGTVDEHHPHWQTFEVIGTPLSPRLIAELRTIAAGSAEETPAGFVFRRDSEHA